MAGLIQNRQPLVEVHLRPIDPGEILYVDALTIRALGTAPTAAELRSDLLVQDARQRRAKAARGFALLDTPAKDLRLAVAADVVAGLEFFFRAQLEFFFLAGPDDFD